MLAELPVAELYRSDDDTLVVQHGLGCIVSKTQCVSPAMNQMAACSIPRGSPDPIN